jgi:hypothetical protein
MSFSNTFVSKLAPKTPIGIGSPVAKFTYVPKIGTANEITSL